MIFDNGQEPMKLPEIPLDAWRPTKDTLHLYCQIVGKIRLAMHPRINHWWHVPLYVSSRGLTTRTIPFDGCNFEIDLDLCAHALQIRTSDGRYEDFALYDGLPVADFYQSLFANLAKLGIEPEINPNPYEAPSKTPFPMTSITGRTIGNTFGGFIKRLSQLTISFRSFEAGSTAKRRRYICSGTASTLP